MFPLLKKYVLKCFCKYPMKQYTLLLLKYWLDSGEDPCIEV